MKILQKHKDKAEQNGSEPDIAPAKTSEASPDDATQATGTPGDNPEQGDDLQAALDEKQKACDELLDRLQRNMAEFDNFRKRSIKEKASMYDDGVRDTVEKLLPIVDNFERAVMGAVSAESVSKTATTAPCKDDGFYKGVEMILRQLYGLLEELGTEVIPAKGETFDPNLHYAVAHIEDPAFGDNEVIEEMQKGYKYKSKVIRPSMVKVAN